MINLVATGLFKSFIPEDEEENSDAFVHFNLDNDNNSHERCSSFTGAVTEAFGDS